MPGEIQTISTTVPWAAVAGRYEIKVVIEGSHREKDRSVKTLMASAHLAAGLGGFDYIDLDTPFFLKKGFEKNPYLSSKGIYDVSRIKAGIGIRPSSSQKSLI